MKKTGMLLLAAVLFLAAAGWLTHPLLARRQALQPSNQTDLRQAAPLVAFTTVALGGFRGILADILWLRIASFQDEGRYFEIIQLADWITRLEPTFTEVWSFHAWNMAYNIGFLFDDPVDRWRWVEHALHMLRDNGLQANPDAPRMYWEVGWLYFNKIGGFADPAAGYYQVRLYQSMESVLPGGSLRDVRPERLLREQFRMEGERMAAIDAALGPFDWRLPESHAVYWAWAGREKTRDKPDIQIERLLYQSAIGSCLRGRIVFMPERRVKVRLVRLDLFAPAFRLLEAELAAFPDDDGIRASRDFLMRMAVFQFYAHGEDETARRWLTLYRLSHPQAPDDVAAFSREAAAGMGLATGGYVERLEALFFEAETQRLQGRSDRAERVDAMAVLCFDGLTALAKKAGESLPQSLEQLRDRGRVQAQAAAQVGGRTDR